MSSLSIQIPEGYTVIVKKGAKVEKGDLLATPPDDLTSIQEEATINLTAIFNDIPDVVRKYLLKGPGDYISDGDVIAVRSRMVGLKRDQVISHMRGTVVRFDRGEGVLSIARDDLDKEEKEPQQIMAPLAGSIKVCNNDSIVIESDEAAEEIEETVSSQGKTKEKAKNKSIGGKVTGTVMVLTPSGSDSVIVSAQITRETINKILLLPDIDKEAIAKAAAIGVLGIIGTELSKDLFDYIKDRKIDIALITLSAEEGKKLIKGKKSVTIDGKSQSIDIDEK